MKKTVFLSLLFILPLTLWAEESPQKEIRPLQVTVLGPVGMNSTNYTNNLSFNVIYGMNGGVKGAEFGTLLNYNEGSVTGYQWAGIANYTTEASRGVIIAGISNIILDSSTGVGISGIFNYAHSDARGAYIAGISNVNTGTSKGFHLSGISNFSLDSRTGFSMAGIANYSHENTYGMSLAGITNVSRVDSTGFSVAGIANLSGGNVRGFHLAPVNITADGFTGFQMGVVNVSRKLKGVQFGVINYSEDSSEGMAVGLITIAKDGLFQLETTAGEVLYLNLNYKMGVDKYYKIFKTGFSTYNGKAVQSFGLGFGSSLSLSENHWLSMDLTGNHILYDYKWSDKINMLFKADINYHYKFNDSVSFTAGPSLNAYITQQMVNGEYGTLNVPYTIYTRENSEGRQFYWIGMNAGVTFSF